MSVTFCFHILCWRSVKVSNTAVHASDVARYAVAVRVAGTVEEVGGKRDLRIARVRLIEHKTDAIARYGVLLLADSYYKQPPESRDCFGLASSYWS